MPHDTGEVRACDIRDRCLDFVYNELKEQEMLKSPICSIQFLLCMHLHSFSFLRDGSPLNGLKGLSALVIAVGMSYLYLYLLLVGS